MPRVKKQPCDHEPIFKRAWADEQIDEAAENFVALRKLCDPSVRTVNFCCFFAKKAMGIRVDTPELAPKDL